MLRKDFISLSLLGLIGSSLFPFSKQTPTFSIDDLLGKSKPALFGQNYKLQKEAHLAFLAMNKEATKVGLDIKIVSSYRNYDHQNRIWNRKYDRFTKQGLSPNDAIHKIIEYSTIPGTSRHHWGTDFDMVDGNVKQPRKLLYYKNYEGDGPFCKIKEWMDEHANSFGFYLVYTNEQNRKGFKYEPWHYSYAPLSIPMLKAYQEIHIFKELTNANLKGHNHFTDKFIKDYIANNILDINPELL